MFCTGALSGRIMSIASKSTFRSALLWIVLALAALGGLVPPAGQALERGSAHRLFTAAAGLPAHAFDDSGARSGGVSLHQLSPEARRAVVLIRAGGPFPYAKDGTVFANRERLLPPKPRGYYREYTVQTPGARDRGARRIVAGERGELYYTGDHYRSFQRIVE
jgi:ribonuclease T1